MRAQLPKLATYMMLAAVLLFVAVPSATAQTFLGGSATYTHDVITGLPTSDPLGPIVVPVAGLEATVGVNGGTVALGGPPGLPLAHMTTDTVPDTISSTATGGLYHLTAPGLASITLAPGVGLGQTDPAGAIGPSAFYMEFDGLWEYYEEGSRMVVPFWGLFLGGFVGAGGFVAFDAEMTFESRDGYGLDDDDDDDWTDHGTLTASYFNDVAGAFGAPLFSAGFPFWLDWGDELKVTGKMRLVADNPISPSEIDVQGSGGAGPAVPLPAAAWMGMMLLGCVGGVAGLKRRRSCA